MGDYEYPNASGGRESRAPERWVQNEPPDRRNRRQRLRTASLIVQMFGCADALVRVDPCCADSQRRLGTMVPPPRVLAGRVRLHKPHTRHSTRTSVSVPLPTIQTRATRGARNYGSGSQRYGDGTANRRRSCGPRLPHSDGPSTPRERRRFGSPCAIKAIRVAKCADIVRLAQAQYDVGLRALLRLALRCGETGRFIRPHTPTAYGIRASPAVKPRCQKQRSCQMHRRRFCGG